MSCGGALSRAPIFVGTAKLAARHNFGGMVDTSSGVERIERTFDATQKAPAPFKFQK